VKARTLVAGSRGSALAMQQTQIVIRALAHLQPEFPVHVERITTTGDARSNVPLAALGRGIFVAELEQALRDGRIDFAVHSAKDLPSTLDDAVTIAAFLPRADARDVLVSLHGTFVELAPGARVGTSSPRRTCQVRVRRSDLDVRDIRGNVDTRLRKLRAGEFDALIIAAAGLVRLGRDSEITEWFDVQTMIPCVGQGALAVEVRSDDREMQEILSALDDRDTRAAVTAERAFLADLGAGCLAAVAAHAVVRAGRIELLAMIGSTEGRQEVTRVDGSVEDPARIGTLAARRLLRGGAAAFLARPDSPLAGLRVAVTRAPEQSLELMELLRARGADPVACPTIAVETVDDLTALDAVLHDIAAADWLAFTSANAVRVVADRARHLKITIPDSARLAAVGAATAEVLTQTLRTPDFTARMANAEALGTQLPDVEGKVIVFARGDLARDTLDTTLTVRGARVRSVVVYRTVPGVGIQALRQSLDAGQLEAIVFASPSSITFASDVLAEVRAAGGPTPIIVCIGPSTGRKARELDLVPDAVASRQSVGGIVEALEACVTARQREAESARQ
jgi:hydroxymethylbilane synthase